MTEVSIPQNIPNQSVLTTSNFNHQQNTFDDVVTIKTLQAESPSFHQAPIKLVTQNPS